jgi:phosphomannomutase
MKFVDRNVELMPTTFLQELFEKEYFPEPYTQTFPLFVPADTAFVLEKTKKLTDFLLSKRNTLTKNYTFVVDFSNGAGVTFEKQFLQQLGDKHAITFINDFPDGTFSAHESDTSVNANYSQLVQTVQERGADF